MSGVPIVGRAGELERLAGALDRLAEGVPSSLAITGEPGMGKTTLLSALCCMARDRGVDVLAGRAAQHERGVPLAVVAEALDDAVGRRAEEWGRVLGDGQEAELTFVFPSLARADVVRLGTHAERFRLHFALRTVLEELAGNGPVMLAVDDAHWADYASAEFLAHVLRRPPRGPVLLAIAYRPREASALLVTGLEDAHREGQAAIVELGPLSLQESAALLGPDMDERQQRALHREAGGNPFYLQQLARYAGRGQPLAAPSAAHGFEVQDAVRASIAHELGLLSASAVRFAWGASVIGEPFQPDLAAEVAELDDAASLAALDELARSDFIRTTTTPTQFTFRHPMVCRAAYEAAGPGWRIAAHRRALAVLQARGAGPLILAPHMEASARTGDPEAVEILRGAGDAAALRAPGIAARWYRAALRCVGTAPELASQRLPLLVALASALGAEGRLRESRDCLIEALAAVSPEEWPLRNELLGQVAFLKRFLGEPMQARSVLSDALTMALPETAERATLLLALAADEWGAGEWAAALEHAAACARSAEQLRDPALLGTIHALVALVEAWRGDLASGEAHLVAAADILDGVGDDQLTSRWDGLCYLVFALFGYGRCQDALRTAQRALAITRASGRAELFTGLVVHQGMAELELGNVERAAEHAEEALEAALLGAESVHLAWAATLRGWVALELGDLDIAIQECERAIKTSALMPRTFNCTIAPLVLAEARLAAGEPGRARDELSAQLDNLWATQSTWGLRLIVEAELALGRGNAAQTWLERAEQEGNRTTNLLVQAHANWAASEFACAQGSPNEAAERALAAAAQLESLQRRLDAGKASFLAARALHLAGDHKAATERLEQLRVRARRWGALRLAAAAEAGTPRRGSRSSSSDPSHVRLTARELDIVELIAKGCTNRQIAEQLFVNVRTVESHVSHILDKLGVRSRAAIVSTAGRRIAPLTPSRQGPT
jgi:DNA-binding CsgD family transcriptional regulator